MNVFLNCLCSYCFHSEIFAPDLCQNSIVRLIERVDEVAFNFASKPRSFVGFGVKIWLIVRMFSNLYQTFLSMNVFLI